MARPKVVRTKEEAAAVPPDLPIQVEVSRDQSVEVPTPAPAAPLTSKSDAPPASAKFPETPITPATSGAGVAVPRDEPEVSTLKAQLEQLKKEREEQARLYQEAQQREQQLMQQAQRRELDWQTATQRAGQAEVDAVNNALAAAQSELASAKSAKRIARAAQDFDAEDEAEDRAREASVRIVQLTDAKANLAERTERAKQQQTQQPQYPNQLEWALDQMGLNPQQKEWFRKHPEIISDRRKMNAVEAAHYKATDKGLYSGSPEYFKFVDEELGFRERPRISDTNDTETGGEPDPEPQNVSAPVSRESISPSSGRPATTRITLTAAQREAARDAGVDEVTYARNLLILQERKRQGMYPTDGGGSG